MEADESFRREQRGVARGMAAAVALSAGLLGFAFLIGTPVDPATPAGQRIAFVIRADAFVVLWLAAGIANVARLRFSSPGDIAAGAEPSATQAMRTATAVLQNTFEQVLLAVFAHLLIGLSSDRYTTLVPVLVGLFGLGRLLFWAGYARGASARALGFGLTFYPSVAALLAGAAAVLI